MNPGHSPHDAQTQPAGLGIGLDDILYTVFRHQRLILAFCCLGLAGAAAVRILRPPFYVSRAKLMVHYVLEARAVDPMHPTSQTVKTVDPEGQASIGNEVEILTSTDVATQAVEIVTARKILLRKGGGDDRFAASAVVSSGLEVEPPRTSIITVSFKHPDPEVPQLVLNALIQAYTQKHLEIHQRNKLLEDYYSRQTDELRQRLAETEEELKRLKRQANVLFLDETKRSYQTQIAKGTDELLEAERDLAEHKAVLGDSTPEDSGQGKPDALDGAVPAEKLSEYGDITGELEVLKKNERELLRSYKEAYPLVQTVRAQIDKLSQDKAGLEQAFPGLTRLALGRGATNAFGGDVASQLAEKRRLNARVVALRTILTNIQAQAAQVMESEPKIAEVQRRRDEEQKDYESAVASLEEAHRGESQSAGKADNISVVQNPTPPGLDRRKMLQSMAKVFAGCVALGFGLAFLIDFVFDRSLKRSLEVERHLRLPVFLTIPDTAWGRRLGLRRPGRRRTEPDSAQGPNGDHADGRQLALWRSDHQLHTYIEGLRERLMTYFEVNNLNLKKPKLVAVTGCRAGAGVSTLASGLAATLSKTGDGNVLLVDMNGEQGMAHSFYQGKPGCGLTAALEPGGRAEALVEDKLYIASLRDATSELLTKAISPRFSHLVPKLKASDYDYIIFDMPPVLPTSATPRLASYMDIVLLVVEAEKTSQHAAARAAALMRESRANVAAVLNKYRAYVPEKLSQDS
jgi:succinoglycan biosynthesis transport protein ExoP